MPLPVFEDAYLLQSLGWAIANSFWQIGILWLVYQFITTLDKGLPPGGKTSFEHYVASCIFHLVYIYNYTKLPVTRKRRRRRRGKTE